MIRHFPLVVLLVCCTLTNASGQKRNPDLWPEIKTETRPWARWWWMGSAVNPADLTWSMEKYSKAGLGGLEITPIYGVKGYEKAFIDFLSPEWLQVFSHTLREAKRLNLGIDLANATGWPFGGPWVTEEDAAKYIAYKTYQVSGGKKLADTLTYMQNQILRVTSRRVDISELTDPVIRTRGLQEKALDQVRFRKNLPPVLVMAYSDNGDIADVTSKLTGNNLLDWLAPPGNWKVLALFQGKHGKMVERAAPGGEGDVIDHFSPEALKHYLGRFDTAFRNLDLTQLRAYFNDSYEVDDASGEANWTPRLPEEFRKRRGYDLREHLPALFSYEPDDYHSRILCDYRETISDLIHDNFTTQWHNWGRKQGKLIRNQAHGSPANILDLYSIVDIPETEGNDLIRLKFASSASNVTGKQLTSSESATWLNEHFLSSLGDVKKSLDLFFLAGINHVFYHGVNYSPKNDPWPGWMFYAAVHFQPVNPFWDDFAKLNRYVARCQSFLQTGHPDNDILLYFPIHESWSEPAKTMLRHYDGLERNFEQTPIRICSEFLGSNGYSFDFISDRMISDLKSEPGKIIASGGTYKTIVFANPQLIPLSTLENILNLAKNGATIVFHKTLPGDVPGFADLETRRTRFKELISGISFQEKESIRQVVYGKGLILLGDDLNRLLDAAQVKREPMAGRGLECIRRQHGEDLFYFVCNRGDSAVDKWIPFNTQGQSVIWFDPMREFYGSADSRQLTDGTSLVHLQLQPSESAIVKFCNSAKMTVKPFPYCNPTGDGNEIIGKWKISFVKGGAVLPDAFQTEKLVSWTESAGEAGRKFAGTAIYEIAFARPAVKSGGWLLDLGGVCESARVSLNGTCCDTLIGPQYRIYLPAKALKKKNNLRIEVSNLMVNRIIDMDKQGIPWKKFYNTNFPSRLPGNRGEDGLFTSARWQPKASGLLGPVMLIPCSVSKKQ